MKNGTWVCMLPWYLLIAILVIGIAHSTSLAVTTIAEGDPLDREVVFVIDAGHGGIDGGTKSVSGILEKELNLQIALRLEDVMHLLGYETIMIRRTDESVYTSGETIAAKKLSDLKERARIVNETENAVLISLHQNFYPDARYSGAQVFYAATEGSRALADELQKNLCDAKMSTRSTKKAQAVYLMEHIQTPGILIECGFLSNPEEDAKLQTDEYQQKLCCVIAVSISQFGKT